MLGFRKADRGAAGFPFATLLEEFDALEALEDGAFAADGGACFEAVMLGHRVMWLRDFAGKGRGGYGRWERVATGKYGKSGDGMRRWSGCRDVFLGHTGEKAAAARRTGGRFSFHLRGSMGYIRSAQAGMAELVDAPDLGSGIARCAGSSPVPGTFQTVG